MEGERARSALAVMDDTSRDDDLVERIVAELLARDGGVEPRALAAACEAHPDQAAEIHRRIDALEASGFLDDDPTVINPPSVRATARAEGDGGRPASGGGAPPADPASAPRR